MGKRKLVTMSLVLSFAMLFGIVCSAFVTVQVKSLDFSKKERSMSVGGSYVLKVSVTPSNASRKGFRWSSSNPDAVSVDTTGKIRALKTGTADITVKTPDGKLSAKCRITVTGAAGKKTEISWASWNCGDIEDGNYVEKKIEEYLNIVLKVRKVDLSNSQQVDLMLASGEMPDCGWLWKNPRDMYYQQELTRTIPTSNIRKYAPSYAKLLDTDPLLWKINASIKNPRELLAMPGYAGSFYQYYWCSFYRYDWLKKLGVKLPAAIEKVADRIYIAEKGFTLDEFTSILDKFTNDDPDGNGKNDTIGMIGRKGSGLSLWASIAGAFGFQDNFSLEEDGKAIYYYSSRKYREFLKFARNLYKRGLVDREILTLPSDKFYEKGATGVAGYFCLFANNLGTWAKNLLPMSVLNKFPQTEILMTPGEIGPDGTYGTRMYNSTPAYNNFYVNKKVNNEKLNKILQMFEYVNFDREGMLLCWWGEEGTHFSYDTKTGIPVQKQGVKLGGKTGIRSFVQYIQNDEVLHWLNDALFLATSKYTLGKDAIWCRKLVKPYRIDLFNKTKLSDYAASSVGIVTIVDEFFASCIIGQTDVDREWDNYIKKLNNAGYGRILQELNKAPLFSEISK